MFKRSVTRAMSSFAVLVGVALLVSVAIAQPTTQPAPRGPATTQSVNLGAHEIIRRAAVGKVSEMVELFRGINDEASAKAAVPKIKALAAELKGFKKQDDALGKLSAEDEQTVNDRVDHTAKPLMNAMVKEMLRLAGDQKVMAILKEAMQDLANME